MRIIFKQLSNTWNESAKDLYPKFIKGVHLSLTITKTKLKEAFKIFRIHKIRLLCKKIKIL